MEALLLNIGNGKRVYEIPIVQIRPCRMQSRKSFSHEKLRELALSIKQNGIIQPITVRKLSSLEYELISGERRLRAAAMCGNRKIPCIVLDCSDRQAEIYSLVENLQRCDLNFFEEAEGIQRLMTQYALTKTDTAKRLGKRQSTISNKLRILKLSDEEKEIILKYNLTERHARALLKIDDPVLRRIVLSEVIEEGMNVSGTEKYIDEVLSQKSEDRQKSQKKKLVIKDIKIFENTINKAVNTMRSSGINAVTKQTETNEFIEFTVRIAKSGNNPITEDKNNKTA